MSDSARNNISISDAEWRIMRVLWDNPQKSMTLGEIRAALKSNWNTNTIRTLIVRLMEKGAVDADKSSGVYGYFPLLEQEDCVRNEAKSILDKAFGGSAASLFSALVKNGDISTSEQKKILEIISSMQEEK